MTTPPALDERLHWAAIAEAITDHEDDLPVFDYGKTPATLPPIFVMLALERTYVPPLPAGRPTRSGWRALFRYVGRSANEARWAQFAVTQAIEGRRLTIDGVVSTPIQHESTVAPAADDGRLSGRAEFTYAL